MWPTTVPPNPGDQPVLGAVGLVLVAECESCRLKTLEAPTFAVRRQKVGGGCGGVAGCAQTPISSNTFEASRNASTAAGTPA